MRTIFVLAMVVSAVALAQEPAACRSMVQADWPEPSKPYFLVIADTSGSMSTAVASTNSCGYENNRLGHARCAIRHMAEAYGGLANFGLMTYAWKLDGCPAGACATCASSQCFPGCTQVFPPADDGFCGPRVTEPTLGNTQVHAGGWLALPVQAQQYWTSPPLPSNLASLSGLVDNVCSGSVELGAASNTPLGGSLFSALQYFSGSYRDPFNQAPVPSPIGPATFNGLPAERPCRSINVILLTDGDETCDAYNTSAFPNHEGLAVYEAGRMFNTGVTVGGQTFRIRTHVIGFAGATISALNNIAAAGGTSTAYSTSNEPQLFQALSNIISGAIKPEVCDNTDNDCNGCTDEGSRHFCNVSAAPNGCCAWNTPAQRATCLANFRSSVTTANPSGNKALLPCTTVAQATQPSTWLCVQPNDVCGDNIDNDCDGEMDAPAQMCGNPAHCLSTEVCDSIDNDCDGVIDEGCPTGCVASAIEVCDGCDNDCDGQADEGISASFACGSTHPLAAPNCVGQLVCKPAQPVASPGACSAGGGFAACTAMAQPEVCDGLDNDCDGLVDEDTASACVPATAPSGLVFGGTSRCVQGGSTCDGGCVGFVGPIAETCDGIDNDCNGQVDDGVTDGQGHHIGDSCCAFGQRCGRGACTNGAYACAGGRLACVGGSGPAAESCNGIDDDCDGVVDDVAGLGGSCVVAGLVGQNACDVDAGAVICATFAECPAGGGGGATGGGDGSTGGGVASGGGEGVTGGGAATGGGVGVTGGGDAVTGGGSATGGGEALGGGDGTGGGGDQVPAGCGCQGGVGGVLPLLGLLLFRLRRRQWLFALMGVAALLSACGDVKNGPFARNREAVQCIPDAGCANTQTDPDNCGQCGVACDVPNATAACVGGRCEVARCDDGTGDVDGLASNGCEVSCPGADGGLEVCDGVDNDCDGQIDDGYSLDSDLLNCGACGNACGADAPNAIYSCDGGCVFEGCLAGTSSADGGQSCDVACVPRAAFELCNGLDDDCNGLVDDAVQAPATSVVCGVSPQATRAECTSDVAVACVNGAWACTFPAGVCTQGCAATAEICDGVDNNCNGLINENVAGFGQPCASDDGAPGTHGACRTLGTFACNSPNSVQCNAVKADCATLPGGCTETCDGVDNDCDGLIDETFAAKGPNATYFVKRQVTRVASAVWMDSYEVSRNNATATVSGSGNGYSCKTSPCPGSTPIAPASETLDRTASCSRPGVMPWTNLTAIEAEQTCNRAGGRLCTTAEWQTACRATTNCVYGYSPRGTACLQSYTQAKFCNLAPSFDSALLIAGDQDGMLPAGSTQLQNCFADWSSLLGNSATNNKLFDLTGNVREFTKDSATTYPLMGGSFWSGLEAGAACSFAFHVTDQNYRLGDTGFRCCFSSDPTL